MSRWIERYKKKIRQKKSRITLSGALLVCVILAGLFAIASTSVVGNLFSQTYSIVEHVASAASTTPPTPTIPPLNIAAYNQKLDQLAHLNQAAPSTTTMKVAAAGTSTPTSTVAVAPTPTPLWPVKTVYPNAGALLPFNRIVAYYGNLYSKQMGVLGEYPEATMLSMLNDEVQKWQAADPTTPVIPALDYIAVTAQGNPEPNGTYSLRMPPDQVNAIIKMAAQINGIVILDVQVGQSNLQTELPLLTQYLKLPQVHLAIDPEFSMKDGKVPGTAIGTFDATDINYAANFLANIVKENNLPPKILIVHRFTEHMVTNYQNIKPLPQVQIVMDMDGWGKQPNKIAAYQECIESEPVQFTGFKLFYKNDISQPGSALLTPQQILSLTPSPVFIQYQ